MGEGPRSFGKQPYQETADDLARLSRIDWLKAPIDQVQILFSTSTGLINTSQALWLSSFAKLQRHPRPNVLQRAMVIDVPFNREVCFMPEYLEASPFA